MRDIYLHEGILFSWKDRGGERLFASNPDCSWKQTPEHVHAIGSWPMRISFRNNLDRNSARERKSIFLRNNRDSEETRHGGGEGLPGINESAKYLINDRNRRRRASVSATFDRESQTLSR